MQAFIIAARGAAFRAIAGAIWGGWLPQGMRVALLKGIMAREGRAGGLSRQIGLLAQAIAGAGAQALSVAPERAARLIRRAQLAGARVLVVAGDSHSRLYIHRARRGEEWLLPVHHLATAASARGLTRADSRSGQGEAILRLARKLDEEGLKVALLLVFGQVDVEFVHMFKRLASDPPAPHDADVYRAFCRETAESLAGFAKRISKDTVAPPWIATVFPPALSDQAWRQGYLNANIANNHAGLPHATLRERLMRAEIPSLAQRTADHAAFNAILIEEAKAVKVGVFDVAALIPIKDGAVDAALLGRAAGADHHLDGEALAPLLGPLLLELGRPDGSRP